MLKKGRPPKAGKLQFKCQQCAREWEAYAWEAGSTREKYCSRECWRLSRIGRPNPHRVQPLKKNCGFCGEEFECGGAGRRKYNTLYCSKSCSRHARWRDGSGAHGAALELSQADAAWLAGVVDGEGCIAWPRRHLLQSIRLMVFNTNLDFLNRVHQVTGTGRVKQIKKAKPKHTQAYVWSCHGQNATKVVEQILPHLIIKREAAEVALGLKEATEPPWTQRTRSMRAVLEEDDTDPDTSLLPPHL